MQYFPYAPTCPPLQGYERTSTGFALWMSLERGQKKPKNGKPCQERPSRSRCPRARHTNWNKKPTKKRARGHTFLIYLWGGFICAFGFVRGVFRWAGWLVRGIFRRAGGFVRGGLDGRVGLCAGVIRIKNDKRYGKVQKIDLRNTSRRMKTKETIFLK